MTIEEARPNMRGWGKVEFASTRLSNVGQFRKMVGYTKHLKNAEPCMFVLTLRFPPKKKRGKPCP
jgi:hypothetical protein